MDHYVEIRVRPDPEFGQIELMNATYAKLHRVLPSTVADRVGVSFPEHGKTLGTCLRLHGNLADLELLATGAWLQGLRDYVAISAVMLVPESVTYRTVRRVQRKSAHNKRNRSIAKGWLTKEQAIAQISDQQQQRLALPYAEFHSLSTNSRMRLYIEHRQAEQAVTGAFNAYGLSAISTVPWF